MNARHKLVSAVSLVNAVCRNIYIGLFNIEQKIILHVTVLPLWYLLLKNFQKSSVFSEALLVSCFDSINCMASQSAHQELTKTVMEPFLDSCYSTSSTASTCDIPFNISTGNVLAHESKLGKLDTKYVKVNQRYKAVRKWKKLWTEKSGNDANDNFILRVISFNILAQNLLESYHFLYKNHDKRALPWETRKILLLREIMEAKANIICLQEMQVDHLSEFLVPFKELGYDYLYKKRTNDKTDGLLFLYRSDQFKLLDYVKVELYQSGIELLSRDNVGIIAKLALKESPNTQIVIATTHLLYNPKRNDVRLGQTQLLLAEIERIAYVGNTMTGPVYLPIILTGDFNLTPFSGVYRFITEGIFEYHGKGRNLEVEDKRFLSNILVPPRLCITDNCQHFDILKKRLRGKGSGQIMLGNSEYYKEESMSLSCGDANAVMRTEINAETSEFQSIEVTDGYHVTFSSGTLTHPFSLYSVYRHMNKNGEREATTNQGEWITVDYIFYSDIQPIDMYTLPTVSECATLPTIPNFAVGSDHLCIGASFKLQKKE